MPLPKIADTFSPGDWSAVITPIAEGFMNCDIELIAPDSRPDAPYDPETGLGGVGSPTVIWYGKARAQHVAATRGANLQGQDTYNPTGHRDMTFQIPLNEDYGYSGKIERGWLIRVLDGGKDRQLTDYLYNVDSGVNSSWAALRTIVCTIDVKASGNWGSL